MNKQYIKELDKIVPNKKVQTRILNNVLSSKKDKKKNILFILVPTLSVFVVLLITLIELPNNNSNAVQPTLRNSSINITYNDTTYCEVDSYNGNIDDLIKTKETIETIPNSIVYKINNSKNIVIYSNEFYNEFEICEEK